MQHSKKAILVTIIFVAVIFLLSAPFIALFMNSSSFTDREVRKELAGELDYLIVGASHGLRSLKPSIIDQNLNCNSYNLCGSATSFPGREALLNEEMARNDIKTVVIEISYDTLTMQENSLEGNLYVIPRLASFQKQATFFFENITTSNWDYSYQFYFTNGARLFLHKLKQIEDPAYSSDKGYAPRVTVDLSIDPSLVQQKLNSITNKSTINKQSIAVLENMVNTIREKGAQLLFVVTPVSDSFVWEAENWSDFEATLADLNTQFDVDVIDFNLLKNRYELFSDETSFFDSYHMSDEGATIFSEEYCKIMNMLNSGESIEELFYNSYAEMKAASPYNNP